MKFLKIFVLLGLLAALPVFAQTNTGPVRYSNTSVIFNQPIAFESSAGAGPDTMLVRNAAGQLQVTLGDGLTQGSFFNFSIAPAAQPAAASPVAGTAPLTVVGGVGGAQSATTGNGAAGGAISEVAGVGGIGGSSSGTAGTGGAATFNAGAGGAGPITGGTGGAVAITGGAGGNGSSAGGSGGAVTIGSGAAGTGGTGVSGTLTLKVGATTVYSAPSTNVGGLTSTYACGAALAANGACANTATGGTAHVIYGSAVLASNTSTITGISPAFTSTSTFFCVGNDVTTRANPVQVVPASSSSITITNTTGATDTIQYMCVGN